MSANLPPRKSPPKDDSDAGPSQLEKDQYSLDEMMKALRDKEREKEEAGEMVTRSDGTLARKVKRRRRRSEQPNKTTSEGQRKRLMAKVVMVAVLVLAGFLVTLFLIIHQNSKGFREKLEEQTADWTGAEVELGGFKRLPFSCQIKEARFQWGPGSYVQDLRVRKVNGDVGFLSFLGARPGGLRLGGGSGEMTVHTPEGEWQGIALREEEEFPFDFDQYFCEALDVNFGEESPLSLRDTGVILSYEGGEGYQVTLDEGVLSLQGWEDFNVSNALLRFKEGKMEVKSLSLEHVRKDGLTFGSRMDLSGDIELEADKLAQLDLQTDHFPLESLIGKQLSRFFTGSVISSEGKILFILGRNEFEEVKVDFKGDAAQVLGFPFTNNLQAIFADQGFEQLEFNEGITRTPLSGTLRVRPSGMALEKLRMAKQGKIRLEGDLLIGADGQIRGRFKLALNRFFLSSHPKLKTSPLLAGTEDSGYVEVEFPLGGTVDDPRDGFLRAIGLDSGSIAPRPANNGSQKIWDQLLEPNGPGKVDEEELDLLPEGMKELEESLGE